MEIPAEDVRMLVGPRAEYYLTKWAAIGHGRAPTLGFNWAAFFGSCFWMLYRRMYLYFWIALGLLVGSSVVQALLVPNLPQSVDLAINLVIAVTFGTFGSYWYYLHTRRQWQAAVAADATTPEALAARGGTRSWPVLIGLVVLGVLLYLATLAENV